MERKEKKSAQPTIDAIRSASDMESFAVVLGLQAKSLAYILYKLNGGREGQYTEFVINQKNGKQRTISAPYGPLKNVQQRLCKILELLYWEKKSVHGFLKQRSIITNASNHSHKRYVFNVDIKDFFDSVNFGRVRGLLLAKPYLLNEKVATIIAQISCFKNKLPQGSPCSPIISNMICSKMDSQLEVLARECKAYYTRYADDITFSTNLKIFPERIARVIDGEISVGNDLVSIIAENGFFINNLKTVLLDRAMRQEVTGLVVNKFVNVKRRLIRQVRSMLHDWEVNGYDHAEEKYREKFYSKNNKQEKPNFREVVNGKIEFISHVRKGRDVIKKHNLRHVGSYSEVSDRFYDKFFELCLRSFDSALIRTEGQTDWMHLMAAWEKLKHEDRYKDLVFHFFNKKHKSVNGDGNLMRFCELSKSLEKYPQKVICIFDRDNPGIVNKHKNGFISYGNNVYSLVLPEFGDYVGKFFSIEMLYKNDFLGLKDEFGRRLYFSDEFNQDGTHKSLDNIKYEGSLDKFKKANRRIVDKQVYLLSGNEKKSVALSKMNFALNIIKKIPPFDTPDFSNFSVVFDVVREILCS